MMGFLKKEINVSHKVVILFVIFNFLIMSLYYTYSIFVIRQLTDKFSDIAVKTNVVNISSNELTDDSITVSANTSSDVTISVVNSSSVSMYYRIMHEGVPTGVSIYEKNGDNTSFGVIAGSETNTAVLTINNTTSENVTVKFLLQESNVSQFDKEIGTSYINSSMKFDHSGAHAPALPSNMIPVYYVPAESEIEEGTWHKADVNNADSNYIWYDYDNFMWANAVTVKAEKRDAYLNAAVGEEIVKDDINAFFVWIPKYKYYVVSGDGNPSYEKIINVNFLNRSDVSSNGTVTCVESISTIENPHLYSEICTDSVYGNVQNNLSTYLHPSFSENDNGFWIGKFANRNYDDFVILNETYVYNKGTDITDSYSRRMINVDNAYGFIQNSNAVYDINTWLYTDGVSSLDSHAITSMEWGAVAILTNSSYGKSNNPMYFNDTIRSFTRVYNNTSNENTGRSSNFRDSAISVNDIDDTVVKYYTLTDKTRTSSGVTYPIGQMGPGASTTGTIYGVYDMAGGNYTTVMGIVMKEDGTMPNDSYKMDSKYYTAYSYIPYTGKITNAENASFMEVFRLGDGIKEHVRTYSEKGMWQTGELIFANYGIMRRGGYTTTGSLFTTEIVDNTETFETFTVLKYNPE